MQNSLPFQIPMNILKLLYDKTNDKRQQGMRELHIFINENINLNSPESLLNLFSAFEKLTDLTQPQNIRRAAFLGYSTIAKISSEKKIEHNTAVFSYIIKNLISNFKDNDNRIVYSSAESLYNLLKYLDEDIMIHFNSIFEGLLLIKVNQEQDVKLISENIDSLLKESINFIFQDNRLSQSVDLKEFFRNIYEKLDSKHPEIKVLIVSWIMFINSIPEVKIINVLHEFLPNLFSYLADNNREVINAADHCLREFRNELESFFENLNYEEEVQILEILIQQALSKNDRIKLTTFEWLDMLLNKYKILFIQSSNFKSPYPKTISFMTLQSKNPENNNNTANCGLNNNFNNNKYYQNLNITNVSNSCISNLFVNNVMTANNQVNNTVYKTMVLQSNKINNNTSLMNSDFFSFNNNVNNSNCSINNFQNKKMNNNQHSASSNAGVINPSNSINSNNIIENKNEILNLDRGQNEISPKLDVSVNNKDNNNNSYNINNNLSKLIIDNANLSNINIINNNFANTDNSAKSALVLIEEKNAEANMSNLIINSGDNNNIFLHPIQNVSPVLNITGTDNLGNISFADNTPKTNQNEDKSIISIPSNPNKIDFIHEKELSNKLIPIGSKTENLVLTNINIDTETHNSYFEDRNKLNEIKENEEETNSISNKNFSKDNKDLSYSDINSSLSLSKKHSVDESNRKPVEIISENLINNVVSHTTTGKNSDDTISDLIKEGNHTFVSLLKNTVDKLNNQNTEGGINNNVSTFNTHNNCNYNSITKTNVYNTNILNPNFNNNNGSITDNEKNDNNNNNINNNDFSPSNNIKNPNAFLEGVNFIVLNLGKDIGDRKIPFHLFPKILEILIDSINSEDLNFEIDKLSDECNETLHSIIEFYNDQNTCNIKLFEHILKKYFKVKNDLILKKVLVWISKLFKKFHEEMFIEINSFIDNFTDLLTRENDSVFCSVLEILCEISKYKDEYIEIIIRQILEKLALNLFLLQNRATRIIKNFCKIIEVNRVYLTFAEELKNMKDEEFIGKMINILDIFLLKSDEAYKLRNYLKKLRKRKKSYIMTSKETAMHDYIDENYFGVSIQDKDRKKRNIFEILFSTWALNPISCINLCFLCEYYELSYHIIQKLGLIKLSDDNYIQLAELVQSLESYNFVNLRIYLLKPKLNKFLVKSLYGILLMIPQGKAYQALYKRLSHMNMILKLDNCSREEIPEASEETEDNQDEIEYYLKIFEKIHLKKRLKHISSQDVKFGNEDGVHENEIDEIDEIYDGYLYDVIQEEMRA